MSRRRRSASGRGFPNCCRAADHWSQAVSLVSRGFSTHPGQASDDRGGMALMRTNRNSRTTRHTVRLRELPAGDGQDHPQGACLTVAEVEREPARPVLQTYHRARRRDRLAANFLLTHVRDVAADSREGHPARQNRARIGTALQVNEWAAGNDCGRQDLEGGIRRDLRRGCAPFQPSRASREAG